MKISKSALLICIFLSIWGVANANVLKGDDYQLQPGDILQISVWNEPNMTRELLIRPDGKFTYPLAGELDAASLTVQDVNAELSGRLKKYIPEAEVTVSVIKLQGNKIYVIGNVNRPGEFQVDRNVDIMQALSIAGGTNKFADLSDILVLRREGDQQISIPFDYTKVKKGKKLEQNIMLHSGDIVVIP